MSKTSKNSSAVPSILEGDDAAALLAEALRLAAQWLCGCGECTACKKVLAGLHVDVPVTDSGPDAVIKTDTIRAVRSDSLLRPFDGDVKVYIIAHAQNMNTSAQNALLRLLEEPPPHARFVLLCKNAGALLPTVRSRCAVTRLAAENDVCLRLEEFMPRAQAYADALDDAWKLAGVAFSWEKLSRDTLKNILRAVLVCLRDRALTGGERERLMLERAAALLSELDQNASVGSVCGVLALPPAADK